jgi:hypothetical protein
MTWLIVGTALAVYALFWSWYVGFGRKMSADEIDRVMQQLAGGPEMTPDRLANIRRFFEQDDGQDFVMVNAIHFRKPEKESRALFARYGAAFRGPLLKRAGHPLIMGRAAASNLENVKCDMADHWSMAALVRYRSRADFAEMAMLFVGSQNHQWKLDAMEKTFAFPAAPWFLLAGPRWVVALAVALCAALVHIAVV